MSDATETTSAILIRKIRALYLRWDGGVPDDEAGKLSDELTALKRNLAQVRPLNLADVALRLSFVCDEVRRGLPDGYGDFLEDYLIVESTSGGVAALLDTAGGTSQAGVTVPVERATAAHSGLRIVT